MVRSQSISRRRGRPMRAAVQRAGDGRQRVCGDALFDLADDLFHDHARGRLRGLGHYAVEAQQRTDQVHVGFHRFEQFRLQQQLRQVQPIDRIALHDLDDGGRKVIADVAEPARHLGRRATETARAFAGCRGVVGVVQRRQRRIHRSIVGGPEPTEVRLGGGAEHQTPTPGLCFIDVIHPATPRSSATVRIARRPRSTSKVVALSASVCGVREPPLRTA
jgi:hypothetical protein